MKKTYRPKKTYPPYPTAYLKDRLVGMRDIIPKRTTETTLRLNSIDLESVDDTLLFRLDEIDASYNN